ncbi:MAG: TrkH family potassium uptake protein [Dethiobacter sp.]|nr:TrkH family potassium uptake protein [Dethiobacter sp.]
MAIIRLNPFSMPKVSPAKILPGGFALLILLGAVLLTLPASTHTGSLSFLDALFTATSAVCVTGLVVVDTGTYFTRFGQTVIMLLIQVGGLGIMTAATLIFILLGKKITLRERLVIQESLNQITMQGLVRLAYTLVLLTLTVQGIGAVLLATRFVPLYGFSTGLFYAVFHAVSAFCNAGFDLFGGFRSLESFAQDPLIPTTIAILLILGGLGFTVLLEVYQCRRFARLSLHAKMALVVTVLLLLSGTLMILLLEYSNPETLGRFNFGGKLYHAFFTAATPRTAGFHTVPTGLLTQATLFFTIVLMFIGASPAGTGGGIKTTTFGTIVIAVISMVRGDEESTMFKKRIPGDLLVKALSVVMFSLSLILLVTLILTVTEQKPLLDILFETTSAFATVGLSTGVTPDLSPIGRVLIIITMFIGRVGPLTLVFALAHPRKKPFRYMSERIMIG